MRHVSPTLALLAVLQLSAVAGGAPPPRLDDADLVVVLPATSPRDARAMQKALAPWVRRVSAEYRETSRLPGPAGPSHVRVAWVPLASVHADATSTIEPEELRRYLRTRFTSRPTTTERPRYLGIAALPYAGYTGSAESETLPLVPRFRVAVRDVEPAYAEFETDVPYGFLEPDTVDGGDGYVDPADLDMRRTTFTVFRIPTGRIDDFGRFVERANAFAASPAHRDAALVAGGFGIQLGDTSLIQCVNADQLPTFGRAGRVFTVLDYPVCPPDFLVTGPSHRLADFLADPSTGYAGGMLYDVSHGNGEGVYAKEASTGFEFPNLVSSDLDAVPTGRPNVFVSISCDNDAPLPGLNFAMAMYLHDSVAVVSAMQSVFPTSAGAVYDAEIGAFVALYQSPITLLQGLHRFRAAYYASWVLGGPPADRPYNWIDLLAVHVLGDGLAIVSR